MDVESPQPDASVCGGILKARGGLRQEAMVELLIVAWDGADPDLLAKWMAEGELPVLRELVTHGAWGPLESTIPPMTPPAWGTFHTGCGPGRHGIFGWAATATASYTPPLVDGRALSAPTFWELLSRDRRVGVMGFPLTYPVRAVDGFWLPGLLSPPDADGHPPGIMAHVRRHVPQYMFSPPDYAHTLERGAWVQRLAQLTLDQSRAALALAETHQPAVLGLHVQTTDTVQHVLWGKPEAREVYRAADRGLGDLIEKLRPRWIALVSDHGMGPVEGEFHVNTWLLEEGFLRLKGRASRGRAFLFRHGFTPRNLMQLGLRMYPLAQRLGLVRNANELWFGSLGRTLRRFFLSLDDVDWKRSVAYSQCDVGAIRLNRVGREPQGIVQPQDEGPVLRQLEEALRELRTPDGEKLVDFCARGSEIYKGPKAALGPELVFLSRGLRWMGKGLGGFLQRERFYPPPLPGGHRLDGTWALHGAGVTPGNTARLSLADIAPTMLALLGVPVPTWMDGRPATELFEGGLDFLRADLPDSQTDLQAEDDTLERLRGLGYL